MRRDLIPRLNVPASASAGELAHITLFRYAAPLRNPASLIESIAATEFHLSLEVTELLVIRERVFPSRDYDVLERLPLAPAPPGAISRDRSTRPDV